ncbi:MAG: hypothetical protein JSS07_11775 [Proteobacteria bacterium]|nr:hypothetical protein [Pseudomonadota bacterium]
MLVGRNTREHSIFKINNLLTLCIDKKFDIFDSSVPFMLKIPSSGNKELATMLKEINWQDSPENIALTLKAKINAYNAKITIEEKEKSTSSALSNSSSEKKTQFQGSLPVINGNTVAHLVVNIMQHSAILPHDSIDVLAARNILIDQLVAFNADLTKKNSPSYNNSEYLALSATKAKIITQFNQFFGQLCQKGHSASVQAFHNFLHLGYIISQDETNKMDANQIGTILGSSMLDAMELDSCLCKQSSNGLINTGSMMAEYHLFAKVMAILSENKLFKAPFDIAFYKDFQQSQDDLDAAQKALCATLWQRISVNDVTNNMSTLTITPPISASAPLTTATKTLPRSKTEKQDQPFVVSKRESSSVKDNKIKKDNQDKEKTKSTKHSSERAKKRLSEPHPEYMPGYKSLKRSLGARSTSNARATQEVSTSLSSSTTSTTQTMPTNKELRSPLASSLTTLPSQTTESQTLDRHILEDSNEIKVKPRKLGKKEKN